MLDRDSIYNNMIDRIERLERRVEDFRDVSRPSETVIVEQPEWQAIAGWVSTGAVLRDVTGKIILDPSIPRIQIGADGYIESDDFVAGNTGFQINGGTAEFNDIVIRGTIYATAGEIAGWTISADNLAKNDAVLHSDGFLSLGTGNDLVRLDAADADYRLWIGHATKASAPFRVGKDGEMWATDAHISGEISATTGTIGGWTITATQIKSESDLIVLDKAGTIVVGGAGGYLSSNPFSSGVYGWRITPTEAEFGNIVARGEIRTAVFKYDEVHAQAGQLLVTPNAAKLESDLTIAATGDSFDVGESGRFAANDIVRLKDGTNDVWLSVTADNADGTYDYDRESGAAVSTVFRAGTAVVGYGASGEGGVLIDAVTANGPFLDVFTHAGSPWTTLTTKVRIGNLAGIVDADLSPSGYGMYGDNVYLKGDLVAGGGEAEILSDGIHLNVGEGASAGASAVYFEDLGETYDMLGELYAYRATDTFAMLFAAEGATATYTKAYVGLSARPKSGSAMSTSDLLVTSYQGILMRGAAGYNVKIGARAAATTTVRPFIEMETGGNIVLQLQDNAGANQVEIQDKNNNVMASIDSYGEILAKGDGFGLMDRICEYGRTPTDHFTSGSAPTGFSWAGAPFATPAVDYSNKDSYLCTHHATTERGFLCDTVTSGTDFVARLLCTQDARCGIRFDDGTDNNYREMWIEQNATNLALYDIVIKYRQNGGGATTTTICSGAGIIGNALVFRLWYVSGSDKVYLYIISETGRTVLLTTVGGALSPGGADPGWTIGRVGILTHEGIAGTGYEFVDWFYSDFS